MLCAGSGFSQQSVIDHCRKTSSDADRIACLEAALLARESSPTGPATEPAHAVVTSEEKEAPPAVSGIGASQVIAREQTADEKRENLEAALGLKVVAYQEVPYERLQVTLENGQVWRQIKGDTQHIRVNLDRNQTVDITESTLGGYKLRLNEMERTIRVQRIR